MCCKKERKTERKKERPWRFDEKRFHALKGNASKFVYFFYPKQSSFPNFRPNLEPELGFEFVLFFILKHYLT
jgi:hypothetical protein